MKIVNENDSFISCTNKETEGFNNILKYLILAIPSGILLLSVISFFKWTMIKSLMNG